MRVTSPRLPLALLIAASAFALTGCSPEAAVPSAPPSAEAEPLFASDEEALAAAEAAYAEYLAVTDLVYGEGDDVEKLREVATGEVLEEDFQRAEDFAAQGLRTQGGTRLLDFEIQQHVRGDASTTEVVGYGCVDTMTLTVVDDNGTDIGDPSREPTATYELTFTSDENGTLLLSRSTFWTAGPECEI